MEAQEDELVDPTAHAYLDESGNSGPNLLDHSQPVYVLGGWIVPTQYVSRVEDAVSDFADRLGLAAAELHGAQLLRTRKGQAAFNEFILAMGKVGGLPVYNMTEKRYWIAGKVVETYLDPFYNPTVPWGFYNDILGKQELANDVCALHDEYLHEFAAAYRMHDADALAVCARRFATLFDLRGQGELASWFRTSIPGLAKEAQDEREVNAQLPSRALGTVNVPVLASFLSFLEALARNHGIQELHIFHDESKEFAHGYDWAFNVYRDADPNVELHLPNGRMVVFTFESVKSMTMVKSNESVLVQAADLLVSALARYARCVADGMEPPQWLSEALDVIVVASALPTPDDGPTTRVGELMGSPRFMEGLFRHLPILASLRDKAKQIEEAKV